MANDDLLRRVGRKVSVLLDKEADWVSRTGAFREKVKFGLIDRPTYCYGMLRAADQAKFLGIAEVTVVEFGVASGAGLLNMADLSELIQAETGVKINIFGFDAGGGLPRVEGYRDHAELWQPGDFVMEDHDGLMRKLGGRAELILGDIEETVESLKPRLSENNPLGFISIDVDLYSATVSALRCLEWESQLYLPGISMYFDDTRFYYANDWAGELLAIHEFNAKNEMRKIGPDRSLRRTRGPSDFAWHDEMWVAHILDHEVRNKGVQRESLTIDHHHEFMRGNALY